MIESEGSSPSTATTGHEGRKSAWLALLRQFFSRPPAQVRMGAGFAGNVPARQRCFTGRR